MPPSTDAFELTALSAPAAPSAETALLAEITNPRLLDQTVEEVFGLMLGVSLTPSDAELAPANDPVTLTAVIGLAGALSGGFTIVVDQATANLLASIMLGIEITELSGEVYDALGEIANMLAGAWKSKIPALHSGCLLSIPTVVTGTHYIIHRKTSTFRTARSYLFDDSPLTINIYGEQP